MRVLMNTVGEKRKVEGTDYSFIKTLNGYQLLKYGFNSPFATGISDFVSFENANSIFLAYKTYENEFNMFIYDNSRERFKKIYSIVLKEIVDFAIEVDLGRKEYYSLFSNFSFQKRSLSADQTVRINKSEFENERFKIIVNDANIFVSLVEKSDDENIRYII